MAGIERDSEYQIYNKKQIVGKTYKNKTRINNDQPDFNSYTFTLELCPA